MASKQAPGRAGPLDVTGLVRAVGPTRASSSTPRPIRVSRAFSPRSQRDRACRCSSRRPSARHRRPRARGRRGHAAVGGRDGRAVRCARRARAVQRVAHRGTRSVSSRRSAGLEQRLRAHNDELEAKVAERTAELRKVIKNLEETNSNDGKLLAACGPCRRRRTASHRERRPRRSRPEARGGQDATRDARDGSIRRSPTSPRRRRSCFHDREHAAHALRPQPSDPRRGRHRTRARVLPGALPGRLSLDRSRTTCRSDRRRRLGSSCIARPRRRLATHGSTAEATRCG